MTTYLDAVFDAIARASLGGAIVAVAVWVLCATFGRLPAAARCTLWWLVSLKLLAGLVWIEPIAVPILARTPEAVAISATVGATRSSDQSHALPIASSASWRAALAAIWLCGVVFAAVGMCRQLRRLSSVRARTYAADGRLVELVRALSAHAGLPRPPEVRISDEIDGPLVAGLRRPVVVLPGRRWPSLTALQQEMAICHELVHLRRGDVWLGVMPALVERMFFFHPLAHLAAREYVLAREAACDADVIRVLDAEPRDYGELLLTLGVAPVPGGFCASGAPHSFTSLKRRIGMLDHDSPTVTVRLAGWLLAAAALLTVVPLTLVARPAAAVGGEQKTPVRQTRSSGSGLEYMLVLGDREGTITSGSFDAARVDRHRDGNDRVLWFRRGGKEYEVRDASSIEEAAAIVKTMSEIGSQQGEIGAKQGAIGAQQGIIGARQGEVGARQGAVGARQGALGARQAELAARQARELSADEKRQIEREQQQIDGEMRELSEKMAELDKEMREVARSMPDLGDDMTALSKQMDVLSRKMTEATAKADAEMQSLVDKLIKLGTAKPVR